MNLPSIKTKAIRQLRARTVRPRVIRASLDDDVSRSHGSLAEKISPFELESVVDRFRAMHARMLRTRTFFLARRREELERRCDGTRTYRRRARRDVSDRLRPPQAAARDMQVRDGDPHSLIDGVGRVIADLLTRDQVRGLMKKVMVRVPSSGEGKSRPRSGKESAPTVMGVLRNMINWGIASGCLRACSRSCSEVMLS